jgi:hypothetical protein
LKLALFFRCCEAGFRHNLLFYKKLSHFCPVQIGFVFSTPLRSTQHAERRTSKLALFFQLHYAARSTPNAERANWLCFFNSTTQHAARRTPNEQIGFVFSNRL